MSEVVKSLREKSQKRKKLLAQSVSMNSFIHIEKDQIYRIPIDF